MKFKKSTHPDFELELVQDGMLFLTGYLNSPEEFKSFAQKSNVRPYVFELDRDFHIISRKPGFVSWQDEYPGWEVVEDWKQLHSVVVPRLMNDGLITHQHHIDEFVKKFWFGMPNTLHLINGIEVAQVSINDTSYGNFYQGVKLI